MRSSSISIGSPRWASSRRSAYASDQLVHRERLDQVVVRSDLQGVYAVVLRAPGTDDDDRSWDPFGSGALDDAPTVTAGEHQVEDTNIRALEAQAGESLVALADDDWIEAGRCEVLRHPLRDDGVVLDDQDLGHTRL